MELGHLEAGLLHEAEDLLRALVPEDPHPHHEGPQGPGDLPSPLRGHPPPGARGQDEAQGPGSQGLSQEGVLQAGEAADLYPHLL